MLEPLTALVTGGARRVGRAIVEELVRAGVTVAFTYWQSAAEAEELAFSFPGKTIPMRCQLADAKSRAELVKTLGERFAHLSALVNNAATFFPTPFKELTEALLWQIFEVNLSAPLFLSRDLGAMLEKGQGAIVNIVDIYASVPLPGYTAYVLSKAGLAALTRQLAAELAPAVRVNAVAPGIALFPEHYDAETQKRLLARTLLKKSGTPEEIARAVRFLLLEAPTVTGQILAVDGGRTLGQC